ncbi:MAG: carboxypeptidase-like regulatory domain-containing protein [Terracidiphilus sp.]|nr:carboxypeptidase-like regulatory domain-containing protein [Terracidiphilus sp.]MDR3776649.1 carboxypeptidase-like regulatory domain-containing protein [Terracidiphilus sp.]
MRKASFTFALILFIFGAFSQRIFGQSSASIVEGMVQDATGAVIQNSDVSLLNTETGGKLTTRTNEAGVYVFSSVQPGMYSLEVGKQGFKSYSLTNFRVTASERATRNVVLGLGSALSTVTVDATGSGSLWEPTSNELGTLIEQENVRDLPLNGRDFLQLGLLSGATQTSGTTVSDFTTLQVGHPDRTIIIDGIEQDLTGFSMNGVSTAGSRLGQASLNLSIAAIDQFKIHEGFFLPSEAPNNGGVVSVVTKGGNNHLHGEAFEFVRNTAFDTRQYFDLPGAQPSPFHRNQFGGAAGGPILHNRLFYFGHYEGRRQVLSNTVKATIPSTKMFGGDFSELSTTIYDPATYDASTGKRQPFAGNIIPTSRINSMATKLLSYYKSAASYSAQNLVGNPVTTDNYDQYGGRIDTNLGSRNTLFGQYVNDNSPTVNAALFPLAGYGFPLSTNYFMTQLTSTLTPHLVNEFRLGYLHPSVFNAGATLADVQGKMGFTGTADPNGVPGIYLSGFNTSGATAATPSFGRAQGLIGNIDNQYQMHESMNLLKAKHEMSFGVDFNYVRTVQESSNFYSRGGVYFNPIYTAQLATNSAGTLAPVSGTGSSFADFLLGMPQTGSVTSMPRTHFRWTAATPYAQDTWRVLPNLTLNFGLGWNMSTPPNPVGSNKNYPHAFNFKTGKAEFAALGAVSPEVYKFDLNNLAPRIGLSWQPRFLPGTIIRAGGGIYYPAENAIYELFAITAPGVAIVQSITNQSSVTPTYMLGQNVFPPMSQTTITQYFADNLSGTITTLDSNLRTTYIEQWSLAIQHSLSKSTIAEIDYIGSQSRKLPIRWNADDCSVAGSFYCDQSVRPYKQFNYIYEAANEGSSSYNAFVAKLQRQFSNGLSFVTNYTWSKVLSNTEQGGVPVGINERGTCLSCDRGMAGYNAPQRLVASSVWNLPLGRGKHYLNGASPVLDRVVGGWTVDTIATFSQGNPFTVLAASSTTMDPMTQYRADQLCDGRSTLKNKDVRSNGHYWFDTACFAKPAANYFGNSAPNIITGPGVNNWDIGAGKLIAFGESMDLQFRADAFNAFNHAQFLNPDSTMTDTNFGKITTVGPSRELQLSLKLIW